MNRIAKIIMQTKASEPKLDSRKKENQMISYTIKDIPKLVDFCCEMTAQITGQKDNNVVYVDDNTITVNGCRCEYNDEWEMLEFFIGDEYVDRVEVLKFVTCMIAPDEESWGALESWERADPQNIEMHNMSKNRVAKALENIGCPNGVIEKNIGWVLGPEHPLK